MFVRGTAGALASPGVKAVRGKEETSGGAAQLLQGNLAFPDVESSADIISLAIRVGVVVPAIIEVGPREGPADEVAGKAAALMSVAECATNAGRAPTIDPATCAACARGV